MASVDWDFGDGQTDADVPSTSLIRHTYATAGAYTVSADVEGDIVTLVVNPHTASAGRESTPEPEDEGEGEFDPSDHTVADVLEHVDDHPDEAQGIYDAELLGKARTTLLNGLEERLGD
jgi:hypothetical protein